MVDLSLKEPGFRWLTSYNDHHLPELVRWYSRISITWVAQGQKPQKSHTALVLGSVLWGNKSSLNCSHIHGRSSTSVKIKENRKEREMKRCGNQCSVMYSKKCMGAVQATLRKQESAFNFYFLPSLLLFFTGSTTAWVAGGQVRFSCEPQSRTGKYCCFK